MSASDSGYQSLTAPRAVQMATSLVAPPSNLYLQREDRIQLGILAPTSGGWGVATVNFNGRFLRADGIIIPFSWSIIPTGNTTADTKLFDLAEGFLLSISVTCSNSNFQRGRIFTFANIVRGPDATPIIIQQLFADYVTNGTGPVYPGSPINTPTQGTGWVNVILQNLAAAGTDWTYTCPTALRLRFYSIQAILTTSATVATRMVNFIVDDGLHQMYSWGTTFAHTAGVAVNYNFMPGMQQATGSANAQIIPAPPVLILTAGWRIRTVTSALQAGDQWGIQSMLAEQWLDG